MSDARLSINQLGEYARASAQRRRRILQDAKGEPRVLVARYKEAEVAISNYLGAGAAVSTVLDDAIEALQRLPKKNHWVEQRVATSVEALSGDS